MPPQRNVIVDDTGTSELKVSSLPVMTPSPFSLRIARVELQESDSRWQSAKLMEADSEDKEDLLQFERNIKSEEPA